MRTRIIVASVIQNQQGEYLLLKMPHNFGAYPNEWGIVGGQIENGETMNQAVVREAKEETGLDVVQSTPLFFADDLVTKLLRDGSKEKQYLIFLLFDVIAKGEVKINDEWETYAWVPKNQLKDYDLNAPTKANFERLGLIE